jgi:DNA replication protein DnaC
MDRILTNTNVPTQFRSTLLDDYDVRRGSKRSFRQVDDWDPTDAKPALVLQGPPNKAKTMLAAALLNEYHSRYQFRSPLLGQNDLLVLRQEKLPVYFIQLADLIDLHIRLFKLHEDVMKGIREPSEYLEIDQLLQDLKSRVRVLVIDDVGKEHTTSSNFAEDAFDLLVRTRHNGGMTTIYTTNIPVNKWKYTYSESMRSLIERSSRIVTFE